MGSGASMPTAEGIASGAASALNEEAAEATSLAKMHGVTFDISKELQKPLDAADVATPRGQSVLEEVKRLRALIAAAAAVSDQALLKKNSNVTCERLCAQYLIYPWPEGLTVDWNGLPCW